MELYQQIFFTTLALAFSILHGVLFLYNPRLKSNLYFFIFLILYALNIFFDFQDSLSTSFDSALIFLRIHRAVMPFNSIFILLFLYSVFDLKISKQFWFISAGLIISGAFAVLEPNRNLIYLQFFLILVIIEAVRIFVSAISVNKEGARLIGTGFSLLFLFSSYDLMLDLGLMQPIMNIHNGYPFGFVLLIISISIYLAQNFAKINKKVLEQEIRNKDMEVEQRLLKAEDARKSKELEEARTIQLSMLPDCAPDVKGLDICFDMRTASEVGGDYYDYQITPDGELILTLGDATGHGMRAGLMVSIIKSLFITRAQYLTITDFFQEVTRTIKQMRFDKLYMSMVVVKLKDRHIKVSSAGMPPLFIYRSKSKIVEEIVVKGMPLGAFDAFSYQTIEKALKPGDTLLLMSDGFTELFNNKNETLGDERVKDLFSRVAEKPSNEIVNQLYEAGDEWRNGQILKDDITLVVCKMKS
jgi:serine phosphatase RsbU (regulator of sigma subunit)